MEASTATARPTSPIDKLAEELPQRAASLSRLVLGRISPSLSRTEVGVLRALTAGPIRITELARREGVTQPAISLLVNRLQERGWVTREADPADRRAVLVAITAAGAEAYDQVRAQYRGLLREEMAKLGPGDVETLAEAVLILDQLITGLREEAA
jgi:DNA-binding MarR family transcriptional regulator